MKSAVIFCALCFFAIGNAANEDGSNEIARLKSNTSSVINDLQNYNKKIYDDLTSTIDTRINNKLKYVNGNVNLVINITKVSIATEVEAGKNVGHCSEAVTADKLMQAEIEATSKLHECRTADLSMFAPMKYDIEQVLLQGHHILKELDNIGTKCVGFAASSIDYQKCITKSDPAGTVKEFSHQVASLKDGGEFLYGIVLRSLNKCIAKPIENFRRVGNAMISSIKKCIGKA